MVRVAREYRRGSDAWINAIPRRSGTYVIAVELSRSAVVRLARASPVALGAGRYLYCGSAKGPGGLRARVGRHVRRRKPVRWHIDQLTEVGTVVGVWLFTEGSSECDLMAALSDFPVPIPGFGSSDCRRCRSHLVRWPREVGGFPSALSAGCSLVLSVARAHDTDLTRRAGCVNRR